MAWYSNLLRRGQKTNPIKLNQRSFKGADRGRLFADFGSQSKSADSEIQPNIKILRARARELARNDAYVARYLNLMVSNVVGKSGIRISSKARNDNGSLDMGANQQIESAWKEWCAMGVCVANGTMSFVDAQKLMVETLYRDGEVLIRHIPTSTNKFGYMIQFFEADHLDEDYNDTANNGNTIKMGVEVNSFDKPVAYYLFKDHPYDDLYAKQRQYIRVPAEELMHIYIRNRPEQTRGVSPISTSMANIQMLKGYYEAEITAARVASSKMGFFTSPDGNSYVGDESPEDGFAPVMNASAGTFEQLPNGMDFKSFEPSHPSTAFDSFTTSILRGIASGLNISYHSLTNDLSSVNYSSIRQGSLEDRAMFQLSQQLTVQHMIEPIFKKWLEYAISSGAINLPISKFDKFYNSTNYVCREWAWIDPLKEINAHIAGLNSGITTYTEIAAGKGIDAEELMEMHQKERMLMEQYDIKTAWQPFGQKSPATPDIEGSDDDS
jgi:lambda family phage portal protein